MKNVNINDLQDWQKSQIFAMLMGRLVEDSENPGVLYGLSTWEPFGDEGNTFSEFPVPNFYNPKNMQYAWRVVNWAEQAAEIKQYWKAWTGYWWFHTEPLQMTPRDTVKLWLDKILEMAISAGLVDWQKLPFKLPAA